MGEVELTLIAIGAILAAAAAIAKKTKTKKDDEVIGVLQKIFSAFRFRK